MGLESGVGFGGETGTKAGPLGMENALVSVRGKVLLCSPAEQTLSGGRFPQWPVLPQQLGVPRFA